MSDHEFNVLGLALIICAALGVIVAIAEQVIQHIREERGRKSRPLPGALGASMEARIAETWPEWEGAQFEALCDSCGQESPDSALCSPCGIEWERLREEYRDERADWWSGDAS